MAKVVVLLIGFYCLITILDKEAPENEVRALEWHEMTSLDRCLSSYGGGSLEYICDTYKDNKEF